MLRSYYAQKSINVAAQMMNDDNNKNNNEKTKIWSNLFSAMDFDLLERVAKMYIKIQIEMSQISSKPV